VVFWATFLAGYYGGVPALARKESSKPAIFIACSNSIQKISLTAKPNWSFELLGNSKQTSNKRILSLEQRKNYRIFSVIQTYFFHGPL